MKFGETFMEYLHGDQEWFLDKCCHVEYKRLKKVLKICRTCQNLHHNNNDNNNNNADDEHQEIQEHNHDSKLSQFCQCSLCDAKFFSELMKEASEISGFFSTRVRHLLHLHVAKGMQRYALRLRHCFRNDQQALLEEGRMLIQYVTMNSIAILKILKKYDKVHSSVNGKNFKLKLRAEHIELLQSPWLIELGAFYLNINGLEGGAFCGHFTCDLNDTDPVITLILPNSVNLDYNLTCPICLEMAFNPYALGCGHLFCKSCACSAASVLIFEGLKTAAPDKKCPVCREAGVYANSVNMLELDLLLKTRCRDYWKERMVAERAEIVKQTKEYWDMQAKYAIGL